MQQGGPKFWECKGASKAAPSADYTAKSLAQADDVIE